MKEIEKVRELYSKITDLSAQISEQQNILNALSVNKNNLSREIDSIGCTLAEKLSPYKVGTIIRNNTGERQKLERLFTSWYIDADPAFKIHLRFSERTWTIDEFEELLKSDEWRIVKSIRKDTLPYKSKIVNLSFIGSGENGTNLFLIELPKQRYVKVILRYSNKEQMLKTYADKLSDAFLVRNGYNRRGRRNYSDGYSIRIPYRESSRYLYHGDKCSYKYSHYTIDVDSFYANKDEFLEGEL